MLLTVTSCYSERITWKKTSIEVLLYMSREKKKMKNNNKNNFNKANFLLFSIFT